MATPMYSIVGIDDAIVLESTGISGAGGVEDLEAASLISRAAEAEVEPLIKFRVLIVANLELDVIAGVGAEHLDIAGVEIVADVHELFLIIENVRSGPHLCKKGSRLTLA